MRSTLARGEQAAFERQWRRAERPAIDFYPFSSHPFFLFQKGAIDSMATAINAISFETTVELGCGATD